MAHECPLQAKRLNKSVELIATSLNTLGLLGLLSGAIVPYWLPGWVTLHFSAHLIFNFIELDYEISITSSPRRPPCLGLALLFVRFVLYRHYAPKARQVKSPLVDEISDRSAGGPPYAGRASEPQIFSSRITVRSAAMDGRNLLTIFDLGQKDRISILLAEYSALRSEVVF